MASSRVCSIESCKRSARALCYCCQQHICVEHLKIHSDFLNDKLLPLADEINQLFDQFNIITLPQPVFFEEFNAWREEAHRTIDCFYERKKQQFEELIQNELDKQKSELDRLRNETNELIRKQETTTEHIDSINNSILALKQHICRLQYPPGLSPLIVDDHLVDIYQNTSKSADLLPLPPPCQTLKIKHSSLITASDDHILLENINKFYLLDRQLGIKSEIPWTHDTMWDFFWSSTLARFIIITSKEIFTLDEKTMIVEQCSIAHDDSMADWSCGTCFHDTLFLTVDALGASIYEFNLLPRIEFVKLYRSPFTCANDEIIYDISSNKQVLALIINNRQDAWHLDLCSSTTFGRYQSIDLGSTPLGCGIRCCPIKNNDWLVVDIDNVEMLHISAKGKIMKKEKHHLRPTHAVLMVDNGLAIVTEQRVDLYQL